VKKDKTRFTIRFNPIDPRQAKAMNALEVAGRRKSTLIADAICEYLEHRAGTNEFYTLPIVNAPTTTHKPQSEILTQYGVKKENLISHLSDADTNIGNINSDFDGESAEDFPTDDEIHNAILDGLAAFGL